MADDTEVLGDGQNVPCAWCGADICIIDDFVDGVMNPGHDLECECGKVTTVRAVDYDVTVYADRKKEIENEEG